MTISVTVLTGRHAGKTGVMPDNVDPLALLGGFAKEDIRWELNWTDATHSERMEWGRADMVGRILAALYHGRYVRFELPTDTREWRLDNPPALTFPVSSNEAAQVVGEIEDTIAYSGRYVTVGKDDEAGVTIVAGQYGNR
jgi:hypothetical protein